MKRCNKLQTALAGSFVRGIGGGLFALALLFSPPLLAETETAAASMLWPLQPGESLQQLARLFYPHNRAMQAVFIRSTQALNPEQQLRADQRFEQMTDILIPDLKALSRHARRGARAAASHRGNHAASVPAATWQRYETLTRNSEQQGAALATLQNRIEQLQQTLHELSTATEEETRS